MKDLKWGMIAVSFVVNLEEGRQVLPNRPAWPIVWRKDRILEKGFANAVDAMVRVSKN